MVLLVEVLHINADFVEKSCHFAYVLHPNADSVEKSLSADTYIASLYVVNPLSGKSLLYHTPAAQRVRKQYRWATPALSSADFPLNGIRDRCLGLLYSLKSQTLRDAIVSCEAFEADSRALRSSQWILRAHNSQFRRHSSALRFCIEPKKVDAGPKDRYDKCKHVYCPIK